MIRFLIVRQYMGYDKLGIEQLFSRHSITTREPTIRLKMTINHNNIKYLYTCIVLTASAEVVRAMEIQNEKT